MARKRTPGFKREIIKTKEMSVVLKHLLNCTDPLELRKNLLEVYHTYLIHAHDALPSDFKKISMNMHLLVTALGLIKK